MKNLLIVERTKAIIISLLMITFGILFIALPETSFNIVLSILAWIFIVVGALWILDYFFFHKFMFTSIQFVSGLLMLCFGLLLAYIPSIYIALIGFALAFAGVQYMGSALDQQRAKVKGWWKDLVYGLVQFVLGSVMIVLRYSSITQKALMIYLGVSLILDGLFILVAMLTFKRTIKNVEDAINDANKTETVKPENVEIK